MSVLDPSRTYTFSQISESNIAAIDLAPVFGYTLERVMQAPIPVSGKPVERIEALDRQIREILPLTDLTSETARREALVAPLLSEVVRRCQARWSMEFPLRVAPQLQGNLDYLLRKHFQVLVIEAKRDDLENGATQLVAEMIALDQWEESFSVEQQPALLGAVTIGTLWQFVVLDRVQKHFWQSVEGYQVPKDIEMVMRILIETLQGGDR